MKVFSPFRLDVADQSLWRDDQRVPLTPKAFAVLNFLVERAGRLVTQNELLEALWPDTFVQPEVLKSQILDVRTALGDRAKEPTFIETVSRRGYRFIAPVRDARAPSPAVVQDRAKSKLIGRDAALDELGVCLQKAESGERQIVFVTGEQGMGKTTLVDAFLQDQNGDGVQFARGQCLEGYGVVKEPYYPVLDALGQLSRGNYAEALARVLETHAPTWLIQLPALMKREHRETLQRELVGATRERMIREICEALERLTEETTLVLLFEDLHWSDHSTVDLIAALAHRRAPAKLMLIGTLRPVDVVLAQHPMKQLSHSLKAHRLCREIALSPLAEAEVAEYLSRQSGGSSQASQLLASWIRKQTDGNPLFMVTVIEHLEDLGHIARTDNAWTVATPLDQIEVSIPDTLRQMIELHIDRLSPREQLALEAASVHGMVFSGAVTATALEVDAEGVDDICQKLAQHRHIVRTAAAEQLPDGSFAQRYEFVHAVFRNVFYHRLAPARRAKLHRRVGETLESLHAGNRAEIAVELAGHFEQCADWPRTIQYLSLAAKNAWQRFDYREAIATLEQALRTTARLPEAARKPEEIRILQHLAVIQHALHDTSRAIPTVEALAARAAEAGLPDAQVRALVALAVMRSNEDCRASLPILERLEALVVEPVDPAAQALMRAQYAFLRITMFGWDAQLAAEHASGLELVPPGSDRFARASFLVDRSYMHWACSRYAEAIESARESLPALLENGRLVRYLHGRDLIATNLVLLGRWGEALDMLDHSIESARKNEAPSRLALPMVFKAWLHLEAMDFRGVAEMCAEGLPSLSSPFLTDRRWIFLRLQGAADLELGYADRGLQRLLELRAETEQRSVTLSWYWRIPLHLSLTEAWLAKGDLQQARLEAEYAIELTQSTAERMWQARAWEVSARVALEEGDLERADRDVKNAVDTIQGFDVPLASWRVHGTAAKVQRALGNLDQERRYLDLSREVVLAIAKSLDTRPELQQIFSRVVRRRISTGPIRVSTFESQPNLVGELIELRPLRPSDFDALFAVASDPLIWDQHPVRNRYQEEVFRGFFREALESGGALAAIDRRTGEVIGSSRFHAHDPVKREIEIGWTFLPRSYWGGKYNGEMKQLMLDHAFQFVDHVIFQVAPDNWRSRKAVEKIGGVLGGTNVLTLQGHVVEHVVYRITKPV